MGFALFAWLFSKLSIFGVRVYRASHVRRSLTFFEVLRKTPTIPPRVVVGFGIKLPVLPIQTRHTVGEASR